MGNKLKSTPPPNYIFKGKPLKHFNNNNYTRKEKIEIVQLLWSDYGDGLLSQEVLVEIVLSNSYGAYTAKLILNDMMQKGILKINPFNKTNKPIFKKKGLFDW